MIERILLKRFIKYTLFILLLFIFTGCSYKNKVSYEPDQELSNKLNNYKLIKINVEKTYNIDYSSLYELPITNNSNLISYYGDSFEDYLEKALQIQLHQNNLLDRKSDITIYTTLLVNELKNGNFTSSYRVIANFQIKDNDKIVYNVNKSINHKFKLGLFGTPIDTFIDNYSIAIQKVISAFLNDTQVIETLKIDKK